MEKKEYLVEFEYDSEYDIWKVHAIDPDGDIRKDVFEVMWDGDVCIIEPGTGCWAIASVRDNRDNRLFDWEFQEEYVKAIRVFLESEEE